MIRFKLIGPSSQVLTPINLLLRRPPPFINIDVAEGRLSWTGPGLPGVSCVSPP